LTDARVLARFDDGDPAIVQVPLEKGSVVLLATTWRPSDSQLALSSKFLPLLQSLLEQSSQLPPVQAQYFVGDEVPLPPSAAPLTVRRPDGTESSAAPASRFTGTDQPGIYHVAPMGMRFAVNLAPEESRTTPIGEERLKALGVPLASSSADAARDPNREARTQAAALESQQKLWRWILIACVALALVETLVAARVSRHSGTKAAPAA
jgi:hypothetical protein